MLGAGVIGFFIVFYIITLLISILIIRWVFRINDIVNELEAIRKLLQKGPFTTQKPSSFSNSEERNTGEVKIPSPEEKLESLRVKFNELAGKLMVSKDKNEKASIRAERERIEKEMKHLEFELKNNL
jgi:protein subunit release factor A